MTGLQIGLTAFGILLVLLALRIPIGVAMFSVGAVGYMILSGWTPLIQFLKTSVYLRFANYDLSVVPLFLLMGSFATKAGMSAALFRFANTMLGHRRGGVAMAAIGACAGFGSICGSSLATAATMGRVAIPELRRYGYSGALATGSLAAGGTLGILIPPSVVLVIYAILVEANIATVFLAAFIPGILAALGYIAAIWVYVRLNPEAGPAGDRASSQERLRSAVQIWPVLTIFTLVLGGIYTGWMTPTEGAAVGAAGTALVAVFHGRIGLSGLAAVLLETASATAMIFLIIMGADLFNAFLALTRTPFLLGREIGAMEVAPIVILLLILVIYLALGCVMDSLSMILLTIPIFWPVIMHLDFGMSVEELKIWFGIIALIVVEVGLITPPVGMNVFIINKMARDVPMIQSFRGVLPFLLSDAIRVALLIAFPVITLGVLRL